MDWLPSAEQQYMSGLPMLSITNDVVTLHWTRGSIMLQNILIRQTDFQVQLCRLKRAVVKVSTAFSAFAKCYELLTRANG